MFRKYSLLCQNMIWTIIRKITSYCRKICWLQKQLRQSTTWLKYHSILFSSNRLQSKKTHLMNHDIRRNMTTWLLKNDYAVALKEIQIKLSQTFYLDTRWYFSIRTWFKTWCSTKTKRTQNDCNCWKYIGTNRKTQCIKRQSH